VEHPLEGTMMSLIREWAAFLNGNRAGYRDFQALFADAYRVALSALEKTKRQLDVLRKNNVGDSGAAGFVRFLAGINRVFSDGRAAAAEVAEEALPAFTPDADAPAFRYCTEAVVELSDRSASLGESVAGDVRQALSPLGDSLIVAPRGARMKIHVHTNAPEQVMERLQSFGALISQKADDMFLQARLRAAKKGGIGLVTDSIADLPDAFLLEHNVSLLPLGVLVGGTAFLDKITIRLEQLFTAMERPDNYPTTSQPEPQRIRALLAERLTQFDSLIVLSVSSRLSNTWQALSAAARELETSGKRVTVVDTRLNSAGATHDEVVAAVTERLPRAKIYVCLTTLAYAVRGGRVPDTIGRLGMKLGLRPIMTLDSRGRGAAFGAAFSQQGLTRKILRLVRRAVRRGGVEAYAIVHGGNPALAAEYRERLTSITGQAPAFVSEVSAAVAIHSGPGTVAVCLTKKGG
jgi:DegV family protein with EDD domain